MASEQVIAELLIEIGVETEGAKDAAKKIAKVTEEADKAEKKGGARLKGFAKKAGVAFAGVAAAAAAAAAGIFKLVDSVTAAGDETAKAARRAGLGAEEFQRLAFAAERSGTNTEAVAKAARNFTRFFDEARQKGATPFTDALDRVGLSMAQLAGLNFEDKLGLIADALLEVEDKSERTLLAQRLLGEEAGPQLASLLESGAAGIRQLGDEAERLGAVLDEDALAASEEFQDAVTNLKTTVGGLVNQVGIELIPLVQNAVEEIQRWVLENRELIKTKVVEWIEKILPLARELLELLTKLVDMFAWIVDAAGGMEGAILSGASAFTTMKLAAAGALGPIGLVITAFTTMLPFAIKLGNALGDVAFQMSSVGREAAALEAQAGGRTGRRGAAAFILPQYAQANARLEAARKKAEEDLRKAGKNRTLRALAQQRLDSINQARAKLAEKNRREAERVAGIRTAAMEESESFEAKFARRQAAGARVREALGKGRRADKIVQQVISGQITESEALAKMRRRAGRGGRPIPEKLVEAEVAAKVEDKARPLTSFEQLLATTLGPGFQLSQLQAVRQVQLKEEQIRPEAVVNITNHTWNINQDISGVLDPVEAGKRAAAAIKQEFDVRLARAGQSTQTNVVR